MAKYQCPDCGYVYDEVVGDPHEGFPAGTTWEKIPEDWPCPDCAVRDKVDFVALQESNSNPSVSESGTSSVRPASQAKPDETSRKATDASTPSDQNKTKPEATSEPASSKSSKDLKRQAMVNQQKETTVIVGGGQAAGALLTTLLQKNYQHEVVLVGEEPYPPYQRPPLSKDYLAGEADQESLYLKPRSAYENAGHQLRLGVRAEQIDRDNKTISLSDQSTLKYDRLVLATGVHVRRLNAPGADLKGIHYLRDIADSDALREQLVPGKRLVIVGGGYIGLEVAASAIKRGVNVTVLEAAERLMQRVTGPEMSEFFYVKHSSAGVDVRINTAVTGFEAGDQGRVAGVTLANGDTVPADVVLVSIGVIPETALAEAAGLACDDGIVVDEFTRTGDPAILAIGDCTRHRNLFFEKMQRLESVANAVDQARIAAATLMGEEKPYDSAPWFWSNQYDARLQMVGLSQSHDQRVVRGGPEDKGFAVFYLRDGCVIAVDAVNLPIVFMVGKTLVQQRRKVDPEMLRDPDIELKSLVSSPQALS